jgi:hypothetical protein
MISEQPAAADTTTLTLIPAPDDLDEGLHIAYWVQWNLFAAGFIIGFFWYARNFARDDEELASSESGSGSPSGGVPEPPGAPAEPAPSEAVVAKGAAPARPKRQKRKREPLPLPIPTRNGKPIATRNGVPIAVPTRNGVPLFADPEAKDQSPAE